MRVLICKDWNPMQAWLGVRCHEWRPVQKVEAGEAPPRESKPSANGSAPKAGELVLSRMPL